MQTECIQQSFPFQPLSKREVLDRSDGGKITSDAGALLVREAGGRITDPFGADLTPFDLAADPNRDIPFLAGGPTMYGRLLQCIRES